MAPPALGPIRDRALTVLLAAFGFVVPLSTAATSVGMAALLVFCLFNLGALRRTAFWREPAVAAGLLLLAWIALYTLFTAGLQPQAWAAVNKYHELLLFAVLFALFRLTCRPGAFLGGLAAGTSVYALAHWLAPVVPQLAEHLTPRYISAGFVLAVTAFVLFEQSRVHGRGGRWMMAVAALLALTVVFTIQGRTGQLLLAMLLAYAIWCWGPRRGRLLLAGGLGTLALVLAFTFGVARDRIPDTVAGLTQTDVSEHGSTSVRVQLLFSGLLVARQHGLTGIGFHRYAGVQEQAVRQLALTEPTHQAQVETLPWLKADNPHNEYLMQLVGGGPIALALFVAWVVAPALRRRDSSTREARLALPVAFAVGCLFNSLLLDYAEAHFYVAILAWVLAQQPAAATGGQPSNA